MPFTYISPTLVNRQTQPKTEEKKLLTPIDIPHDINQEGRLITVDEHISDLRNSNEDYNTFKARISSEKEIGYEGLAAETGSTKNAEIRAPIQV